MPPNMLKAKAGGGLGGMDMAAMKRAADAVEALKPQFGDWIAADVTALTEARGRYAKTPGPQSRAALMRAAHDIKGFAPALDFPLMAEIAASLSRLLGEFPPAAAIPMSLIDAHVGAIQAIHRRDIRTVGDDTALTLCAELDARVKEALAAARKTRDLWNPTAGSADQG
ncbi:MAG TPA: hypothetical protein VGM26_07455 [Rhizomicrobium sp.]